LCLLAKLFLDHKTLFYDVEGFTFYALYECDSAGAHIAAYFSKETNCETNILACIVVFPPYQKKGYGQLLISMSYEIARRSNRVGGPERPLSDLGKIAFHSYWRSTILELFRTRDIQTIDEIIQCTVIARRDVIEVLDELGGLAKVRNDVELSPHSETLIAAITAYQEKPGAQRRIDRSSLIWLPGDERHNHLESLTDPAPPGAAPPNSG
jgi:histone acetyltransferase MYST1